MLSDKLSVVSTNSLSVDNKYKEALNRLTDIVSQCEYVDALIVFGSVVKGNVTANSDIDICLFSTTNESELMESDVINKGIMKMRLDGILIPLDILIYKGLDDLREQFDGVFQCVEKDIYNTGVVIYRR